MLYNISRVICCSVLELRRTRYINNSSRLLYIGAIFIFPKINKKNSLSLPLDTNALKNSCIKSTFVPAGTCSILMELSVRCVGQLSVSGCFYTAVFIFCYTSSPKSAIYASISFSGQSETASSLPVKKRSVLGS